MSIYNETNKALIKSFDRVCECAPDYKDENERCSEALADFYELKELLKGVMFKDLTPQEERRRAYLVRKYL